MARHLTWVHLGIIREFGSRCHVLPGVWLHLDRDAFKLLAGWRRGFDADWLSGLSRQVLASCFFLETSWTQFCLSCIYRPKHVVYVDIINMENVALFDLLKNSSGLHFHPGWLLSDPLFSEEAG